MYNTQENMIIFKVIVSQVLNPLIFSTILEGYMLLVRNLPLKTIKTNYFY